MFSEKTKILLKFFTPQKKITNPKHTVLELDKNLSGKIVVFTGGTNGIGRSSVKLLFKMGATIIVLARSKAYEKSLIKELKGNGKLVYELCDLSSLSSVKKTAEKIKNEYSNIDFLINCAGVNIFDTKLTNDGFEYNWAVNYFAPYILTNILLDNIKGRIVNLTTDTTLIDELSLIDVKNFITEKPYYDSKLALEMFSLTLSEKLEFKKVGVNNIHPGNIKSNLFGEIKGFKRVSQIIKNFMASPTIVGAERVVRSAISSEYANKTGLYIYEDDIKEPHKEVKNKEKRELLEILTKKVLQNWLG